MRNMQTFQKKSRHSILSLSILGILLVAGCAGAGPEALAKALPDVQKFLSDHPNADITVALLGPDNMKDIAPLLKDSCPAISADNSYYKVLVKDSDTNSVITIWIDSKSSQTVCATRTGATAFVPSKVKVVSAVTTTIPEIKEIQPPATGQAPLPPGGGVTQVPKADILITYKTFDLDGDGVNEPVVLMQEAGKKKIFLVDFANSLLVDTVYLRFSGDKTKINPTIGFSAYYYDGKNYKQTYPDDKITKSFYIVNPADSKRVAGDFYSRIAAGFDGKNAADATFSMWFFTYNQSANISAGEPTWFNDRLIFEFVSSPAQFASVSIKDYKPGLLLTEADILIDASVNGNENSLPQSWLPSTSYSLKPKKYSCVQMTNGAKVVADENGKYIEILDFPLVQFPAPVPLVTDCNVLKTLSVPTTAQQGNETTVPTVIGEPSNQTTATTVTPSIGKNETATQASQVEYKTYIFELAGGIDFTGDGIPDDAVRVYDANGKDTIAFNSVGNANASGLVAFKTSEIYLLPEKVNLPYSGPKIWPAKVFVKGFIGTADASEILLDSLQFEKGFTLTQTSNYNPTIGHFVAYTINENFQQQVGGYSGIGAELTIEYLPRTNKRAPSFSDGNGDNAIVGYYYQYENTKKEWVWATKDIYKTGDDDKCFITQRGSGVSVPKSLKQIKVSIADYVSGESYGEPHFC